MARDPERLSVTRRGKRPSFFKVLIGDFQTHLRIPPGYVKRFDSMVPCKVVLQNSAKRSWTVVLENVGEILHFTEGWSEFVHGNALEFGDFVAFFHMVKKDFEVKVYGKNCCEKHGVMAIERKGGKRNQKEEKQMRNDEKNHGETGEPIDMNSVNNCNNNTTMQKSRGRPTKIHSKAPEAANNFTSKYPFFKVVLQKAYVTSGLLYIPTMDWTQYIRKKTRLIKLKISGKLWPVKMIFSQNTLRLSQGWLSFVTGNFLQVGDVCAFELIERDEVVLQVTVFKALVN